MTEIDLGQRVGLSPNEVRKYMGTLHLHRLVKRHVNREKQILPEWKKSQLSTQAMRQSYSSNKPPIGDSRTRDVHYWYLDYREFANVTKYRLAMMRKGIDERIKSEVGQRGYQCPQDGRVYDTLDVGHLFDPTTSTFRCEDCQAELIEHDPTIDQENNSSLQDMMQRFNIATAPIRDALKAVEVLTLPSTNVIAWIAQNVKTGVVSVNGQEGGEDSKKFEVVIGGEDDEAKEKLAQAQREQNALPEWYTHSTVTGDATTLGINDINQRAKVAERAKHVGDHETEVGDQALAAHYELLDEEDDVEEVGVDINEGVQLDTVERRDEAEVEEVPAGESLGKTVFVNGQMKKIEDVTEDDQELMTSEEYEVNSALSPADVWANWNFSRHTRKLCMAEKGRIRLPISDSIIKFTPRAHTWPSYHFCMHVFVTSSRPAGGRKFHLHCRRIYLWHRMQQSRDTST